MGTRHLLVSGIRLADPISSRRPVQSLSGVGFGSARGRIYSIKVGHNPHFSAPEGLGACWVCKRHVPKRVDSEGTLATKLRYFNQCLCVGTKGMLRRYNVLRMNERNEGAIVGTIPNGCSIPVHHTGPTLHPAYQLSSFTFEGATL